MEKQTYAVIIPSWHAAIPEDWDLEVNTVAAQQQPPSAWEQLAGKTVMLGQGDLLRASEGPAEAWLSGAEQHRYVTEVKQ